MTEMTIVLPPGAADGLVSHGDEDFKPFRADHLERDSAWMVTVPPHVAQHFLHNAGFSMPRMNIGPLSSGEAVVLHQPGGPGSCSWNGVSYEPDEQGHVTVPAEAVAVLVESHGFKPVPPDDEAAAPAPGPATAKAKQSRDGGNTKPPADPDGTPHPDVDLPKA